MIWKRSDIGAIVSFLTDQNAEGLITNSSWQGVYTKKGSEVILTPPLYTYVPLLIE